MLAAWALGRSCQMTSWVVLTTALLPCGSGAVPLGRPRVAVAARGGRVVAPVVLRCSRQCSSTMVALWRPRVAAVGVVLAADCSLAGDHVVRW
jgi:hypothetical protein